jgi:uncharacterized repeat protein (TIGR01451 family)
MPIKYSTRLVRRTLSVSVASAALFSALSLTSPAYATGTRAGTVIDNTATATYDQGGTPVEVDSNINSLTVDELLDTVVVWDDGADVPTTPGATGTPLTFTLTNTGNGEEAFVLSTISTLGGDNYDPTAVSIVIDDGDGVYEPGIDVVYVSGAGNPVLDPDETITIFVVANTPGGLSDGDRGGIRLVAAAATGTGAPGTTFPNAGEGGGDAVVGTTGADGSDDGYYQVSSATVSLVKSATVADPFGGSNAVPGSIITYQIVANTSGSGSLPNLMINDAIPAGTTYRAGTITLGGTGLTDAADADAGTFAANNVSVSLGTVAGGQTRTVTFQVTIN